jgi:hypothetical protein
MSEKDSTIKVADRDDTYLEEVSGRDSIEAETRQTTCSVCGLAARNQAELEGHVSIAHR